MFSDLSFIMNGGGDYQSQYIARKSTPAEAKAREGTSCFVFTAAC